MKWFQEREINMGTYTQGMKFGFVFNQLNFERLHAGAHVKAVQSGSSSDRSDIRELLTLGNLLIVKINDIPVHKLEGNYLYTFDNAIAKLNENDEIRIRFRIV